MLEKRSNFEGLFNILRYNIGYYLLFVVVFFLLIVLYLLPTHEWYLYWCISISLSVVISWMLFHLAVTWWVYDNSGLYGLQFLPDLNNKRVLMVNAGLDEISEIVKDQFPNASCDIIDFYNPEKHTEASIKRARKLNGENTESLKVQTEHLPFHEEEFDVVIAFFSLHEIRDRDERNGFLRELNRVSKTGGKCYVTEHLRDWKNLLVYTFGYLHFFSKKSWLELFAKSKWKMMKEYKNIPLIITFELEK